MYDDRYGLLFQSYFTGPTGRLIQERGAAACILGAYLASCRHANMIGLYELPLTFIAHDLPVIGGVEPVREAMRALGTVNFAHYDEGSDFVWVVEMARIRCGLAPDATISTRDKRHQAIVRLYAGVKANPFLGPFFDRYQTQLALPGRRGIRVPSKPLARPTGGPPEGHREAPSMPLRSASDAASKALASPSEASNQDQDQDQDQKQDQESGSATGSGSGSGSTSAAALTRHDPNPNTADDNVEVITSLVLKEVLPRLPNPTTTSDVIETTKAQCAARRIAYNSQVVTKAVESALYRAQHRV